MDKDAPDKISQEDRERFYLATNAIESILRLVPPRLSASILAKLSAYILHGCVPKEHKQEALGDLIGAIKDTMELLEEQSESMGKD